MRIGEVIGTVTLNRSHPSLLGARFKLTVPLSLDDLAGRGDSSAEELVVYDELGAGVGSRIAISEGREAAMPFYPDSKPVDAYNAAILDTVHIRLSNIDSI
ncbi:MAG: carbon dioxide concentrating mechanism protein CcmL [Pirellulales bacterium]|nr:carbon dioxide concentrating mechanism protein CcmL [Pirellulales bacterium]